MLKDEISGGETDTLEFKEQKPVDSSKYVKAAIAMSNSQGGRIIFGVSDKCEIVGVDGDPLTVRDGIIDSIMKGCTPQILPNSHISTFDGKNIIVIEIPVGLNRPYHVTGENADMSTYVRVSASNRLASPDTVRELMMEGEKTSFDSIDYIGNVDEGSVEKGISDLCALLSEKSDRTVTKANLINLGLLRKSGGKLIPTRGFMLLTENPYYHARIQCARFRGFSNIEFIDRKEYTGSVISQIDEAVNFVMNNVNLSARIEGVYREDIPEIPPKAIREIITNAVLHRSYNIQSNPIFVAVYDDRIEVISPGLLPMGITVREACSDFSRPRNMILARFFREARLVEGWGTGIPRSFSACIEHGLRSPEMEELGENVRVRIYRKNADGSPSAKKKRRMADGTEFDVIVLDYLENNPKARLQDVSDDLGRSKATVKRTIADLKNQGILVREGSKKNGNWIICRVPKEKVWAQK